RLLRKRRREKPMILNAPKRFTITLWAECATTNPVLAGDAVMLRTHVTHKRVTVRIFTPISLHWRAASAFRLALRSVQPFLLTKTRAGSTVIIVGLNSWQMVAGFPLTSARRGRIQSWRITISGIIRLIVSN